MNHDLNEEDLAAFDRAVPRWQRTLNAIYEVTFGVVDRFLSRFENDKTQTLISDFKSNEARHDAASKE